MGVELELVRRLGLGGVEGVPVEVHLDVGHAAALRLLDAVHDHVRHVAEEPVEEVAALRNLHAVLEELLLLLLGGGGVRVRVLEEGVAGAEVDAEVGTLRSSTALEELLLLGVAATLLPSIIRTTLVILSCSLLPILSTARLSI